jgi:hypothetical protein
LVDEFTRKCLAIRVARRIHVIGGIEMLADAMLFEGGPTYIRSDSGPEMVTRVLRQWPSASAHHNRIASRTRRDHKHATASLSTGFRK